MKHETKAIFLFPNNLSGFPKSFTSVLELTYFVTMVIFNASAQHTAVNNSQVRPESLFSLFTDLLTNIC